MWARWRVDLAPQAAMLFALVAVACGGSGSHPGGPTGTSPAPLQFSTFQSAHFSVRHTDLDAASVSPIATAIEAEYQRILRDFNVTQMPTVTVTLYPTGQALSDAVSPIVGPLPSFAKGLVTGPTAVHILSPNLQSAWSYADGVRSIVHEFAHCVSLRVNPSFGNNPRWWWESVALFEAGQLTDPRTLPYFTRGPLPTFAQLSSFDNTIVYEVGATIGRFVVATRGWGAYVALVESNGDVNRVLGLTERAFLDEWAAFVRASF